MEAGQMSFLSGLASSIAYVGYYSWMFWKKRKNSYKIFGVLCSEKSGVSEALKKVEFNEKLVLVDVSEVVKMDDENFKILNHVKESDLNYYNALVFEMVKDYLLKIKKVSKNKIVVVLTSNVDLLKYLKVCDNAISVVVPTIDYQVELIKRFEKEDDIDKLQKSKEKLTELKYPIFKFKSHSKLVEIFEVLFNPKNNIKKLNI
jgi:hypothetical protein